MSMKSTTHNRLPILAVAEPVNEVKAFLPIAVFPLEITLLYNAPTPTAVFSFPVVFS